MKILFVSHTPMGGSFVVGSHHLARAMTAAGHAVAHLGPPVTPAHVVKFGDHFERQRLLRWFRGGEIIDGVLDLTPASAVPWALARRLPWDTYRLYGRCASWSARALLRRHGFSRPDVVFVDEPRLGWLVEGCVEATVVYRPTDLYASIRADDSITEAERRLCARARHFIATSAPVADHLRGLGVAQVQVIENGVDFAHFSEPAEAPFRHRVPAGQKVAVYAGAFDRRFGLALMVAVVRACPDVHFSLIGPIGAQAAAVLGGFANVCIHGPVPFARLPSYFASADVGLLPLSADPSNQARSPMKLYEYAAAGLPVVATRTQELERRRLGFVTLADGVDDFARAVREADRAASAPLARAAAADQGWQAKAETMLSWVLEARPC
ncbi:MAG: glycosyltransferase [Rhodocyclaceae bacterium]|nr:glycosyltransferase [Rhodocyclaceae bacterium]